MKRKFFNILLCLLLVISLAPAARAATLDTADLTIDGNTVTIGSNQESVLAALHAQGKTAKIAIPYEQAQVYVLKDDSLVVSHNWDKAGYIQFQVPGAGKYVITAGAPVSLEMQLEADSTNVIVFSDDVLTADHNVAAGTVIHANGNTIQGVGSKTLTAEGNLTINGLNGTEQIRLDTGDKITFDSDGNAAITPAIDSRVGYGNVKVTTVNQNGIPVTRTYFLVAGETLRIYINGEISGNSTFAPGNADAVRPDYWVIYADHDNTHLKGSSDKISAICNGLYAYYSAITITPPNSSTATKLAEKVNGSDVVYFPGVTVWESGTVLTMDSTYLNTLSMGDYTLTFHYADGGYAAGILRVVPNASVADDSNPKTGDWILLPTAMMIVCMAVIILTIPVRKKGKH